MENKQPPADIDNNLDVKTSKTSTSRFYFYIGLAGYVAFFLAMCFGLWKHRYDDSGKQIKVQSSTLYHPKYK